MVKEVIKMENEEKTKGYTTPIGKLESFIAEIPNSPVRIMNWNKFKVPIGGSFAPAFFNEIKGRLANNRSCIITINGPAGEGKTYAAMRLGQIFDDKFDPTVQIVFEREHFLQLIGRGS
jgi:hypothetical protein